MACCFVILELHRNASTCLTYPDSEFHGPNMGPISGRQDSGGPHIGPMNFVIWVHTLMAKTLKWTLIRHHSDTFMSGLCLINIAPKVFAIWVINIIITDDLVTQEARTTEGLAVTQISTKIICPTCKWLKSINKNTHLTIGQHSTWNPQNKVYNTHKYSKMFYML